MSVGTRDEFRFQPRSGQWPVNWMQPVFELAVLDGLTTPSPTIKRAVCPQELTGINRRDISDGKGGREEGPALDANQSQYPRCVDHELIIDGSCMSCL